MRILTIALVFLLATFAYADWEKTGGGSTTVVTGSTPITGGADTEVLFNDGGVVNSDPGVTLDKTNNGVTVTGWFAVGANPADAGEGLRLASGGGLFWEHTTESSITDTAGVMTITPGANSLLITGTNPSVSIGTDPGDDTSNSINIPNGGCITSEASPAGTDISFCSNATEYWQSSAGIYSDTFIQAVGSMYVGTASGDDATNAYNMPNGGCLVSEASPDGTDMTFCSNATEQWVSANDINSVSYSTATNCIDSAGDAACTAAPAGSVVVDAADTATVVSTTVVTANSQIFLQIDASLGTRLSVTCNTQAASVFNPRVTARTAATSFTITVDAGPTTNPLCLSYFIVN